MREQCYCGYYDCACTKLKIGDKIRDIEDGDCYFEGTITYISNNKITYLVERVLWCDIECLTPEEDSYIGKEIEPRWWYLEKINE